jgi:hypothetical protein
MNFRQQSLIQSNLQQHHFNVAKTQSTIVKSNSVSKSVESTPEEPVVESAPIVVETPVVEETPVIVEETLVVETPVELEVEPEIPSIPENRFESIFPRI